VLYGCSQAAAAAAADANCHKADLLLLQCLQVDGFFLRRCKQGTVQFVLLKPLMAALVLIMYAAGAYTDGDMSPSNG
jgi:hypothetical protein